jgi:hypothetical protein
MQRGEFFDGVGSNSLYHGSLRKVMCKCRYWASSDSCDSGSNSSIECMCGDSYCALYEICHEDGYIKPCAYVEKTCVTDVYQFLSNHGDVMHTVDSEWAVRLLRWILAPLCKIAAAELSFVVNHDLDSLDILFAKDFINNDEKTVCFRIMIH